MTSFTKGLWHPTERGVLMPSGSVLEGSSTNKTNFLHVKSRAKEIEDLYASAGLAMSPTCGLAQLIENAKTLADRCLNNQTADSSMIDVFYALHLDRLADAILSLRDVPGKEKYLNALTSGELRPVDRITGFDSRDRDGAKRANQRSAGLPPQPLGLWLARGQRPATPRRV